MPDLRQYIQPDGTCVLPNTITRIEDKAFERCERLKKIIIPDSVEIIGSGAFLHCNNITSIIIPASVKNIGSFTFGDCSKLKEIMIPDVERIGAGAFMGCEGLEKIIIPDSVEEIGDQAFLGCSCLIVASPKIAGYLKENADRLAINNCTIFSPVSSSRVEQIDARRFLANTGNNQVKPLAAVQSSSSNQQKQNTL